VQVAMRLMASTADDISCPTLCARCIDRSKLLVFSK
jgi:hypothetical protein